MLIAPFVVGLLALPPIAAAGPTASDPCQREGDATACFVAHEQEFLDVYGLAPAASAVAAGAEIRRAMFIDGYGRDTVAVEFRRAPGSGPQVAVFLPRDRRPDGIGEPALTGPVPLADWEMIGERSHHFDRRLVPEPGPDREAAPDETIYVCTHAWLYFVEYTDPAAENPRRRLRRRVEDACERGLTADYAILLADVAARLLPGCAVLDPDRHRNSASLLNVCARFTGDRAAAALAYNRIAPLRGGGYRGDLPLLRALFAPGAVLDWQGERIERNVADTWFARTDEPGTTYFSGRLHGESARRVREQGALHRWVDADGAGPGDSVLERAPVELVWSLGTTGLFQIEQASVGGFTPVEGVCPPGLLTGAERANNCRR